MEKVSSPEYYPVPQPERGATTIVATNFVPAPTSILTFGPNPLVVVCPSCHKQITTVVRVESSSKTHMMAAILCLVCCCCCIPYCMDSCKNRNHYCQSCGAYLGTYTN